MNRRIISILLLINLIVFNTACASHSLSPNNRVSEETKSVKNIERKRIIFERVDNVVSRSASGMFVGSCVGGVIGAGVGAVAGAVMGYVESKLYNNED